MNLGTPFGKVFGIKSIVSFLYSVTSKLIDYIVAGEEPKQLFDYEEEKYFVKGKVSAFADALEHTATTNGTMVDSDGVLKWRPHNFLADTVGLTTNWATTAQGTGSTAILTRDYAAAPDDTMTAARLQCSRTSARGQDRSYLRQTTIPTVIGSKVTEALWVKSTDGTSQTIQINNTQENNTKLTETVGASWQRISLEYPILLSTSGQFWIGLVGAETTDLTTDVLIWHPHLYRSDLGGMASDPDQPAGFETEVPTTGSSAVYLPRRNHHIYNGSAWVNEGILIEPETRTSIFERSSPSGINYNGNSGVASPTISQTNPFTSEDDAALITASAGAGSHYAASNAHFSTPATSSTVTTTVWVERGTSRYVFFEVYGPGPAYQAACVVDLDTLSVTTLVAADVAFYVTEVANGVYSLSIADTTNGSIGTPYVRVGPHDGTSSATWTASGTETVKLLAVQVEEGSTPSSYIPTTGSQVTRAGEQLVLPHENISWPEPKVIGSEQVTNGTFDTDLTGWTLLNGAVDNSGAGYADITSGPTSNISATQTLTGLVIGAIYLVSFTRVTGTGNCAVFAGPSNTNSGFSAVAGDYSFTFVATATSHNVQLLAGAANSNLKMDNISVREIEPLTLSIHMQGLMTYADTGSNNTLTAVNWEGGGEQISYRLRTDGTRTGAVQILQRASSMLDTVETASGSAYSPGVNVPFSIASRHGSTFVNGAVDGVAMTENTTPTALPDLETADLQLAYSGGSMVINLFRMWDVDIGDAGTEDATEDISGALGESGNWNDAGAWSGSEDFDGTSGADLQVEINNWLMAQDSIDSRLDALEE